MFFDLTVSHNHSHDTQNYDRAFAIGVILNLGFVAIEVVYGFLSHSIALLADAGHNLSDVLGLLLAWGASWLSRRRPSDRFTYGLRRSSIFAALINATTLIIVVGGVAVEATQRLTNPLPIAGRTVMVVAFVGIIVNGITAFMFHADREKDLNRNGAFLHLAADAIFSFGVVLSGLVIVTTGWLWIDPVMSLGISAAIAIGTWHLLRDAVNLALDGVPSGINGLTVRTYLSELAGVVAVHDLHIWAMSTTEPALTVHLVMPTGNPGDGFLSLVTQELHNKFGIEHVTIQVETGNFLLPCNQKNCCP
jgi:cobalt-zinc-cadmium efflux system protein